MRPESPDIRLSRFFLFLQPNSPTPVEQISSPTARRCRFARLAVRTSWCVPGLQQSPGIRLCGVAASRAALPPPQPHRSIVALACGVSSSSLRRQIESASPAAPPDLGSVTTGPSMPRRRSHAHEGMMTVAQTRRRTRIRHEQKNRAARHFLNKNRHPNYSLLNTTAVRPSFVAPAGVGQCHPGAGIGVPSGARSHGAGDGSRRCGLHERSEDSSRWQRPWPGERPP